MEALADSNYLDPTDFPGLETGKERPIIEKTVGALTLVGLVSLLSASGVFFGVAFGANELYQQAKRAYFLVKGTEFERVGTEESFFPYYRKSSAGK